MSSPHLTFAVSSNNTPNCTYYPDLKANPDIGGIGLIIAFVLTAYTSFICCIAKAGIDYIRSPVKETPKLDIWSFALGNVILSFSDQQLVTGISVIVGGVSQLKGGLDSYHWQTVANLAWFSAFTHMATLTVVRQDDRLSRVVKGLRVFAMGVLVIMLLCVIYSVGWLTGRIYIDFDDESDVETSWSPDFPAWCLYHHQLPWAIKGLEYGYWYWFVFEAWYNWLYVVLASAILIFTYLSRVCLLFSGSVSRIICTITCILRLNKLPYILGRLGFPKVNGIEVSLDSMSKASTKYRLLRSLYTLALSGKQMYLSTLWEFTWLCFALGWGSIRIFTARNAPFDSGGFGPEWHVPTEENTWQFGQVVSLVLLILPFLCFFDAYAYPPEGEALMIKDHPESQDYSKIRTDIQEEPWYKKLLACWYLLSSMILFFTLFWLLYFGGGDFNYSVSNFENLLAYYVEWMLVDLGVLWTATLIFIDHDIQAAWKRHSIGKFTSRKLVSYVCWGLAFIVITSLSSIFVLWRWQLPPFI